MEVDITEFRVHLIARMWDHKWTYHNPLNALYMTHWRLEYWCSMKVYDQHAYFRKSYESKGCQIDHNQYVRRRLSCDLSSKLAKFIDSNIDLVPCSSSYVRWISNFDQSCDCVTRFCGCLKKLRNQFETPLMNTCHLLL